VIKLLIDECLSPDLADIARGRWIEASHVTRIGKTSYPDWRIAELALSTDCGLVTNNARDFRRFYKRLELHPGLLILVPQGRYQQQIALFRKLLDYLESNPDIVNQLVEVDAAGVVTVTPWARVSL
jgi:predicted nuclease of predicted toxin-antitoxin system